MWVNGVLEWNQEDLTQVMNEVSHVAQSHAKLFQTAKLYKHIHVQTYKYEYAIFVWIHHVVYMRPNTSGIHVNYQDKRDYFRVMSLLHRHYIAYSSDVNITSSLI